MLSSYHSWVNKTKYLWRDPFNCNVDKNCVNERSCKIQLQVKHTGIKGNTRGVRNKDTVWGYCVGKAPCSLQSLTFRISLLIFFHFSGFLLFSLFSYYFSIFYYHNFLLFRFSVKFPVLTQFFQFFSIALALKFSGIFSIAYLRAVLGISFLLFMTYSKTSRRWSLLASLSIQP